MSCNNSVSSELPEMKTVEYVDIERYMGDWYAVSYTHLRAHETG